jgi:ligand-binding sensor domain-containing protein
MTWVGTSKGPTRFRNGEVDTFTAADGSFADYVFTTATNQQGALWIIDFGGAAPIPGIVRRS